MAKTVPQRGLYSRYISIIKIILPLVAIALLATVFLFTTERTIEGGLNFSPADLVSLESGVLISKPRFSGSNAQGDEYNFSADLVRPDAPNPTSLKASGLSGEIIFLQGTSVQLSAGEADFAFDARTMRLTDGVAIVFSDGFRASSENLFAELDMGRLTTNGPVTALSLMGNIQAGNLRVETEKHGEEENRMIWFENGVKLVIKLEDDTGASEQ